MNKDYTTSKRVKNNKKFIEIISQLRVVDKSSTYGKYSPATRFKSQGKAVDVTGNEANDALPITKVDI